MDHEPRSRVCKKKRRRDRLIALAEENPDTWVIGFEDECWWSRLARPSLNSWVEEGEPLRLRENPCVSSSSRSPKTTLRSEGYLLLRAVCARA